MTQKELSNTLFYTSHSACLLSHTHEVRNQTPWYMKQQKEMYKIGTTNKKLRNFNWVN